MFPPVYNQVEGGREGEKVSQMEKGRGERGSQEGGVEDELRHNRRGASLCTDYDKKKKKKKNLQSVGRVCGCCREEMNPAPE